MKRQKCASRDFSEENLPHNRIQVFFDCLKLRFRLFLGAGVLLLLFSLPSIVSSYLSDFSVASVMAQLSEGVLDEATAANMITSLKNMFNLINIPCLAIFGLGLGGIVYVLRRLIWAEGIFFKNDFFNGIKYNGLRYALIFALAGVVIFLDDAVMFSRIIPQAVSLIPTAVSAAILVPVALFMLSLIAVYNIKAGECIKNSVLLFIKTFPKTIGLVIALACPFLMILIPNIMIKAFAFVLYVFLLVPISATIWLLYSCYVFDQYINLKQYPEVVDKGVYREKKEKDLL